MLLRPPSRLCFHRCLTVCLLATLRKNVRTDLHEIFREGWQWTNEKLFFGFDTTGRWGKLDCCATTTSLRHRPTTARQRLRCTQRAVSSAHDIARLVKTGLGGGLHSPRASSFLLFYPFCLSLFFRGMCVLWFHV